MADLSDVMDLLENLVTAMVYPNGTNSPSLTNKPVSIGQGWPLADDVDKAMTAGNSIISIYAEQSTTSAADTPINSYYVANAPAPGVTVTVNDPTITIGGNPKVGDVVGLVLNTKTYTYAIQTGDTPNSIAAALFALVHNDFPASSVLGPTITTSGVNRFYGAISSNGVMALKLHRQRVQFQIVVWSPTHKDRSVLAAAVDIAIKRQVRQPLPDTSSALLSYQGTNLRDKEENMGVFRRDVLVNVIYETIDLISGQSVTLLQLSTGT